MPGSMQAEDARIDMVRRLTLRETGTPGYLHPAWVERERTRNNHLSLKGSWFWCGKLFTWFTPTHGPQPQY